MSEYIPFQQRKRMTRLGEALAKIINSQPKLLLTNYEIYRELWKLYEAGDVSYLRGEIPTKETYKRTRHLLRKEGIIRRDEDYAALWRVLSKPDASSEDIICSVDPYCYISHISAMQRYGLTNRRPEALYMTQPTPTIRRLRLNTVMETDYGEALFAHREEIEHIKALSHPEYVRGRAVAFHATKFFGEYVHIKGTFSRLATIGQTFLDMIEMPSHCGGMIHVLDIWSEHARTYLDEIIARVETIEKPILKVRAGYILDEHLAVRNPRIEKWLDFVQRGSSRVLDPGKPFSSNYSEKWMLSLNA